MVSRPRDAASCACQSSSNANATANNSVALGSNSVANAQSGTSFLTGVDAQSDYANANYEYPVNEAVQASELLLSWGEFKTQDIDLSLLGKYNAEAVKILNEIDQIGTSTNNYQSSIK